MALMSQPICLFTKACHLMWTSQEDKLVLMQKQPHLVSFLESQLVNDQSSSVLMLRSLAGFCVEVACEVMCEQLWSIEMSRVVDAVFQFNKIVHFNIRIDDPLAR